jgi:hypothetical protein
MFMGLLHLYLYVEPIEAQVAPDDIVGVWFFDEGKGDTAKDSSANHFDGTIQGAKWDDGKFGKALNFSKGNTVVIPLKDGTVRDKISVLMWINFLDLSGQQNYFSVWDSSSNRYVPYKTDGSELRFWTNNWNHGSGFTVKAKTWYHVANVYDGKTAAIYVDGEQKVSQPGVFSLAADRQTAWVATDRGTGFLSNCIVDDFGLFKVALTKDKVKNIMEKGTAWALGLAGVEPSAKLTTTWGTLKTQHFNKNNK